MFYCLWVKIPVGHIKNIENIDQAMFGSLLFIGKHSTGKKQHIVNLIQPRVVSESQKRFDLPTILIGQFQIFLLYAGLDDTLLV